MFVKIPQAAIERENCLTGSRALLYSRSLRMTKQELIEKLAVLQKKRNLPKAAAADVVESLFDNLALAVRRGKRFSFPGFGTFQVKKRKERRGRNPQTGQEIVIPSSKTVTFRASQTVKEFLK
jgi:DNA-binding protein HU-beta